MATNDRPARLALTAAVLVLLLGAAGVLVQQRFSATASPGGTVAGIEVDAPAGTRVSVRPAPEPAVAAPATRRVGGGADLAFDGAGPVRVRIPVPAPPPAGFGPVVIDRRTLVPAVYDAASRSIVADLVRPGAFWGGLLDFAALGREAVPDFAPRPGCAGRSAGSDGVVVALGSAPPLSPCVTAGGGRASVTLTSNARVPYRLTPPPGWPEPTARTVTAGQPSGRPRQRDLLWPGAAVTYDVPFGRLPGTVRGQAEPGPAIGTALAAAAHRLAVLFGMTDAAGPAPEVLACAADAGAEHVTADRPEAAVWAALGSCHPAGGDVVRRFLEPGVGPVTAGLAAAQPDFTVPVTTSRAQRFTQTVEYRPRATTARATGACASVSAVSGRHDAYRCTSGGTTYDPCFAVPGPRVVCPVSAVKAVALTYSGALPTPPDPGGTADPFLLALANGAQCAAVPDDSGTRFACADGTVLSGGLDTSGPLWTIAGLTVAKAYT
ncbi:hypothetical protein ACIRSS_10400 [Amycolatopsis sp. NPDC101161]|uniref:hypothetical protein n=1 Tax=Amycolatopsis sp. NPDC101161 TaxID=3363940 RepID=UPI00382B7412